MKNIIQKTTCLAALGSAVLLVAGCKTVIRENVISTIDTGFGASIIENKQTQVPEIKVGYIRSQFYSVPTGKMVENSSTSNAMVTSTNGAVSNAQISNAANVTPNMVAGIRVESGWKIGLFDANISENFALGDIAVNSKAATAMYIAEAKTDAAAGAASLAIAESTKSIPSVPTEELITLLPLRNAYVHFYGNTNNMPVFDAAAKSITLTTNQQSYADFRGFLIGIPQNATAQQILEVRSKLEANSEIKPFVK